MTSPKKILIAEDDSLAADALAHKLRQCGHDIKVVSDGEEAFIELKNNQYDLLLLDLIMPKIDGFTLLDSLQKHGISLPIIVISNLCQLSDIERVRFFGITNYFVKSNTSINDVICSIKDVLAENH